MKDTNSIARWILRRGVAAILAVMAFGLAASAEAWAETPRTAAVFDFELIDTSLEGELRGMQPAEQARLIHVLATTPTTPF